MNNWYDADPSWKNGPDYEEEYPCMNCTDRQELIKYYEEDKVIAGQALAKVISQLYTDTTFDKVALNTAIENLCQVLGVNVPYELLNVTRKQNKPDYEHEYYHYALDQARRLASNLRNK